VSAARYARQLRAYREALPLQQEENDMTNGTKHVVHYALEKTTPGAVRYMQVDETGKQLKGDEDGALAATIYFRKKALGDAPQKLKITVEAA
jgi:hypothetical protein